MNIPTIASVFMQILFDLLKYDWSVEPALDFRDEISQINFKLGFL